MGVEVGTPPYTRKGGGGVVVEKKAKIPLELTQTMNRVNSNDESS